MFADTAVLSNFKVSIWPCFAHLVKSCARSSLSKIESLLKCYWIYLMVCIEKTYLGVRLTSAPGFQFSSSQDRTNYCTVKRLHFLSFYFSIPVFKLPGLASAGRGPVFRFKRTCLFHTTEHCKRIYLFHAAGRPARTLPRLALRREPNPPELAEVVQAKQARPPPLQRPHQGFQVGLWPGGFYRRRQVGVLSSKPRPNHMCLAHTET